VCQESDRQIGFRLRSEYGRMCFVAVQPQTETLALSSYSPSPRGIAEMQEAEIESAKKSGVRPPFAGLWDPVCMLPPEIV
jgi:hypothetical protein